MPKAKVVSIDDQNEQVWIFCPGCNTHHAFTTKHPTFNPWTWNGDIEKPTFSPSMLVFKDNPECRCHSFVRDGKIEYLSDCFHDMKNKTVELPDIDEDFL